MILKKLKQAAVDFVLIAVILAGYAVITLIVYAAVTNGSTVAP